MADLNVGHVFYIIVYLKLISIKGISSSNLFLDNEYSSVTLSKVIKISYIFNKPILSQILLSQLYYYTLNNYQIVSLTMQTFH